MYLLALVWKRIIIKQAWHRMPWAILVIGGEINECVETKMPLQEHLSFKQWLYMYGGDTHSSSSWWNHTSTQAHEHCLTFEGLRDISIFARMTIWLMGGGFFGHFNTLEWWEMVYFNNWNSSMRQVQRARWDDIIWSPCPISIYVFK